MSSSSSFPSEAAPDTPGGDPMEAYATQHALEKDAAKEAHLSGVNVNVDDAAVLKEAEAATPGPLVGAEGGTSLAKRVHEAATKGMPGEEATMKVRLRFIYVSPASPRHLLSFGQLVCLHLRAVLKPPTPETSLSIRPFNPPTPPSTK